MINTSKKIALVTGGSSGLGFAMAEALGREGYELILIARNQERLTNAVNLLKEKSIIAHDIACDITDEKGILKVFEKVKNDFGKIDYLVLNAGVVSTKLISEYSSASELKKDIEIDLWGTMLCSYQFLPLLVEGSKIVMISSGFGLMGAAGYAVYCAAKAGVINFGEALRRELISKKINVYVACPGDMDTPQFHEEIKNAPQWMKKSTPRKLMQTETVAKRILAKAKGSKKFLIIPSADVKQLVVLSKILPRKFRDYLLDKMFPRP